MKQLTALFVLLTISTPSFASEILDLYPKSRAAYQSKFEANTEMYEVNGRNYVDNLYESRGENNGSSSVSKRQPMLPEADLDAYINGTASLTDDGSTAPTQAPPLPSSTK